MPSGIIQRTKRAEEHPALAKTTPRASNPADIEVNVAHHNFSSDSSLSNKYAKTYPDVGQPGQLALSWTAREE
jgi:hypothetical protein